MAKRKAGAENGNPEPDPVARLEATIPESSEAEEMLEKIKQANAEVMAAHGEYVTSKERTAQLKKRYEGLVEGLQDLIRELTTPLPLFERPAETKGTAAGGDDGWRTVPLSKLDIADTILGHLTEAGLETVGQLADFTAGNEQLTDIKGIGESKAEQIEQALDRFWSKRKADQWRDVRLSAFLPASIVEALGTEELGTMGDLADYSREWDFDGLPLSREGLETLANAVRRYWQARGGVESSGFELEWLDLDSDDSESAEDAGDEEPEPKPRSKSRAKRVAQQRS